jgi:hypothetical protein
LSAYENKLKVTLNSVNAPLLIALGSLIPGAGGTVEKLLKAAASSNGLATTGKGTLTNGRLRFIGDNVASWLLGSRLILDIPLASVTGLYRGASYLGGYYFTLRQGETSIDMSAIYGGKAFLDQLEREIRKAGGQT